MIGEKATCIPECLTITLCSLSWYCSDYWLCHWCSCETTAVGNSELWELGSPLVTSLLWAPVSSTALRSVSEAHLCPSPRTVPAAVTPHVLVVVLAVTEQMGLPGSAPAPLLLLWVFSICRAGKRFCRGMPGFRGSFSPEDSCSCKLLFSCILPLSVLCVLVVELDGWPWAVGPLQAELGTSFPTQPPSCCTCVPTACCYSE